MKTTNELKENAIASLKKRLKPGDTIYHTVKHVARSGMSRTITFFIADRHKKITCINWELSHALGYSRDKSNGALKVGGCGMDMGFHVVYSTGRALFPKGFKLAKGQHGRNGDRSRTPEELKRLKVDRWYRFKLNCKRLFRRPSWNQLQQTISNSNNF